MAGETASEKEYQERWMPGRPVFPGEYEWRANVSCKPLRLSVRACGIGGLEYSHRGSAISEGYCPIQSLPTTGRFRRFASAEEMEILPNGARQSKLGVRFDLLPPLAMQRWAEVFGEGARKHGQDNDWRGIPANSHWNHGMSHLYAYLLGDPEAEPAEDDLGHALWRFVATIETLLQAESQLGRAEALRQAKRRFGMEVQR